jgi:hypothetical protein
MALEGVRRSSRVPREIPILLFGSDTEGRTFSEETKTVILSRYGAGIVSEYKLSAEQEVVLRRLDINKEAEFRVVGQIGSHGGVYTYGVAFTSENPNFWEIAFPALTESELAATLVILECIRCESKEAVHQSDLEWDVFIVNDGIVRSCRKCGSSTFWKRAPAGAIVDPAPPLGKLESSTETVPEPPPGSPTEPELQAPTLPADPPARLTNRRKHVRAKVRFQACIRSFDYGDEVVNCEDMSRGGVLFTTRQKYATGTEIQLAVPYSPGSPAIFVRAQIIRVNENARDKTFQCGVQFIANAKQ